MVKGISSHPSAVVTAHGSRTNLGNVDRALSIALDDVPDVVRTRRPIQEVPEDVILCSMTRRHLNIAHDPVFDPIEDPVR
jgi:hypothetical protein